MLLGIYLTLSITAFTLFILGTLIRNDNSLILSWVATILFVVLALSSFDVRTQFCELPRLENTTVSNLEFQCYTTRFTDPSLAYLMYGMTIISLALSIYWSVTHSADTLANKP